MVLPFDLLIVGRRCNEAENTPALATLYTRFLQCFVSRCRRECRLGVWFREAAAIFQNAGCTMALHAECTTRKIRDSMQAIDFIGV
jgi:hypothetical protein